MKIVDFKNFEQFQLYIKQHATEMPFWSIEQTEEFNNKFNKLMEESPEFKEKYNQWTKHIEIKQRIRHHKIVVIGESNSDDKNDTYVKAYLKLKEVQKQKKQEKPKEENSTKNMSIVKKIKEKYRI